MNYDRIYRLIRQRPDLSGNAKVVFSWLAQLVRDGLPHPGRRVVASECGITDKTAARVLDELEQKGLITTVCTGPGCRPRYTIHWNPTGVETTPVDVPSADPNRGRNDPGQPGEKLPRSAGVETTPVEAATEIPTGVETTPATGVETTPATGVETTPHPDHSRPFQREPRACERAPARAHTREAPGAGSSLSELPDPWEQDAAGVGSFDFVWRVFRQAALVEGGETRDVQRSHREYALVERLERQALKLAARRAAADGRSIEDEFRYVLDVALRRFAEEVRTSNGRVPWKVHHFDAGWGRHTRGLDPEARAA